jgi:dethiobiotin synthetase
MSQDLFVTGTDTSVGKTVLSALLVAALDAVYWKPIQTGATEGTDRQTVMKFAEIPEEQTLPETYLFNPPVSPHLAARMAGARIDLARIRKPAITSGRPLVVEGAGGVLVPVNDSDFMLDMICALGMPVVVAARSALGTINHTCLTVGALRDAGASVKGVVTIGAENRNNEEAIATYSGVPIIGRIPQLDSISRRVLLEVFRVHFDRRAFPVAHA